MEILVVGSPRTEQTSLGHLDTAPIPRDAGRVSGGPTSLHPPAVQVRDLADRRDWPVVG